MHSYRRWRRRLAFVIYVVGILGALGPLVSQLSRFSYPSWFDWLLGSLGALMYALAAWWVTAGIAIRPGLFPVEFFSVVARWLGLTYEAPIPDARRVPARPEASETQL